VAGDDGGKEWREEVAGRVAAKAGGKHGGANAKRREKFLQKIGFNKPDLAKSGSTCPIFRNRVHPPRLLICCFSFFVTAQKNVLIGFLNPDITTSGSSNPIFQFRVQPPRRCIISEIC
jgi:hypothetical protein